MEMVLLTVALVLLLALNAFFVLGEFAVVKIRPTRVAELIAQGDARAKILADIQRHLDDYLSVCQVGITLASVALGMVGTRATEVLMGEGQGWLRYALAIGFSYAVVSGSHIVVGELVPKSIAIRVTDAAALRAAPPLRFFRWLFTPALWALTSLANLILRAVGLGRDPGEEAQSEQELRIILERSQGRGLLSFRRLLLMENVFDFGGLSVRDAMRPRGTVRVVDARRPWAESLAQMRSGRFTRYPLLGDDPEHPLGYVHVKDLFLLETPPADLGALVRPLLTVQETAPLEAVFAEMQRRRRHAAVVRNPQGTWTGFITFEDVIEELLGTIRDEFEDDEPIRLSDALTVGRVRLGVEAGSVMEAIERGLGQLPAQALPLPADRILEALASRERQMDTYLGQGVGIPHARIAGLPRPFVMLLRSELGVPCAASAEKAHLLFVLLTPSGQPRAHQRLLSIIATLLHESEYVRDRLLLGPTPEAVFEAIRTGEQAVLD